MGLTAVFQIAVAWIITFAVYHIGCCLCEALSMGTILTVILSLLLAAALFFALKHIRKGKGCGGSCSGCPGCGHSKDVYKLRD